MFAVCNEQRDNNVIAQIMILVVDRCPAFWRTTRLCYASAGVSTAVRTEEILWLQL